MHVYIRTNNLGHGFIDFLVDGTMIEAKHGVSGDTSKIAKQILKQFRRYAASNSPLKYAVPNEDVKDALLEIINGD
ncbi:hypothetical protein, partial [Stieleria mannarensis]|uniref:hypothetical protein n=1 Tax=Stieleria mannarensis TaxID=2755585 RepID=UPI001C727FD7